MKSLFFFWLKNIFHGIGGHFEQCPVVSVDLCFKCGSWSKVCFEQKQEAKGLIGQKRVQHL